jgi:peptidoglycan/LPS O-acetylase OafA/YrhL
MKTMTVIDKKFTHKPGGIVHPKYRVDIDGLRAVAVLSVIIFHTFPNILKGGFIGVDIFFVISGFLISTIIFSNLENGSFLFSDFFARRVKRIFPALILVLTASFVFGWFALLSLEYKELAKHLMAGVSFISNFVLWSEAGYFDSSAEAKPFLHLWSLGIEEQFYIFWPLLLWLAHKLKVRAVLLIIVIAGISFYLNISTVATNPTAAFYSPQTRFWELLVGSGLAYATLHYPDKLLSFDRVSANLRSGIGALLLLVGLLLVTREKAFPGWWAILPTFGAAFLISAGPDGFFNRLVLSNKLMVWFGKISFPLYLWHWPFLAFAFIIQSKNPWYPIRIAAILVSLLCAWLTFRFVEKPLRFGSGARFKTPVLVSLMILLGGVGYLGYENNGFEGTGYRSGGRDEFAAYFENSMPEEKYFQKIDHYANYRMDCDFYDMKTNTLLPAVINPACYKKIADSDKTLFIWGDSHAQMLYSGLAKTLPKNWQVLQIASSGCFPSTEVVQASATNYCDESNWSAMKAIGETKPDVVIVGQRDYHDPVKMQAMAQKLLRTGVKKVIFTGPAPQWKTRLPNIVMRLLWGHTPVRSFTGMDTSYLDKDKRLKADFPQSAQVKYLSLVDQFCNADGCMIYIGNDVKTGVVTWDYGHLSPVGSKYLADHALTGIVMEN